MINWMLACGTVEMILEDVWSVLKFHRGNDITLAEEPKVDSSPPFVPSFDTADFPQPFLML